MAESKKDIETSEGGTLRKQNSAPGSLVTSPQREFNYAEVRKIMLTLADVVEKIVSKMPAGQRPNKYSGDEALVATPQSLRDTVADHDARRQNDMSTAQGQEGTSCGERDSQRRLCVSAPAVLETRFVLPGAIDDEEWVPAVVSTPAAALDEEERSLPGKMPLLYEVGRQIGRGAFSKVDEGTRQSDGMKSGKEIFTKISSNPRTLRQTDPVPAAVEVNTPLIYWASLNVMPSRCLTNDHRRNLFNLLIRLHISPKGFSPPRTFFPPCKKIQEVFLLGGFFNPGSQPTLA
nr:uncharacterized protein LOC129417345 isoform X2 [Misgurnus anguillicaudatus]